MWIDFRYEMEIPEIDSSLRKCNFEVGCCFALDAAEAEGSGYKNEAQVRAREIMSVKGRGLAKASVLLPASFP
jgi:hypothetical protein